MVTTGTATGRGVRVLVAFVLVAAAVLVLLARPAAACSCGTLSDEAAFERADVVFVGEVDTVERMTLVDQDPSVWVFRVDEVHKGVAARTQGLVTARLGASCGLELPTSGRVVVFARNEASSFEPTADWDTLHASLCDGSRAVADPLPAATFGPPRAPVEGSAGLPPVRSTLTSPRTLTTAAIAVVRRRRRQA